MAKLNKDIRWLFFSSQEASICIYSLGTTPVRPSFFYPKRWRRINRSVATNDKLDGVLSISCWKLHLAGRHFLWNSQVLRIDRGSSKCGERLRLRSAGIFCRKRSIFPTCISPTVQVIWRCWRAGGLLSSPELFLFSPSCYTKIAK